jgi:DNA-binding winged helix-turn-helix (wHTH) protein/TolB-like protein
MDRAVSLAARRIDLSIELPFRLGGAAIDPRAHEIRWDRESRRIQPLTMKVLVALHDRSGDVVTRDELVDRCWDGRFVGEDVINRCVSLLRRVADESGAFEIETVPRAGYRLVEGLARPRYGPRRWLIAASAAAVLAVIAVGVAERSVQKARPPAPTPAPTIALMPFTANSADGEAEKLATATREAVANSLSQGAYSVRTADGQPGSLRAPADFVISGELTTMPGKAVASVRMEEEQHHVVVFSHQFEADGEKAWRLPEQVGAQIASQLSWTAPLVAMERRHPSDPAVVRQLFEESTAGLEGAGNLAGYEASRRLAMATPNSPLAQMDFAYDTAFALSQLPLDERENAVELGRRASDRAIALAPESGEPYAPWCMLHSEARAAECEDRLRKAMRVDPDAPFAASFLAHLVLNPVGRNAEAAELARLSLAHDPYMPNKIGWMVRMLEATGQTDEAEHLYRQSMRWWPGDDAIVWRRFSGIIERGDFEAARRFDDQTLEGRQPDPVLLAISRGGLPAVRAVCAKATDFDSIICMLALARLGDLDSAFGLADKLYPARRGRNAADADAIWLKEPAPNPVAFLTSPAAAPMRRDPRYLPLAQRLGLLDYWRSGRLPDFCTQAHEPVCARIERRG